MSDSTTPHDDKAMPPASAGSICEELATKRPGSISRKCYQPCDTGADGWLVIDSTEFRTVHLRRSQAEWFLKGLADYLRPAQIIPLRRATERVIESEAVPLPPRVQEMMAREIRKARGR